MPYVHVNADDFEDDELVDELESRGYSINKDIDHDSTVNELIRHIFEKRRVGKDYQHELDDLIYTTLGRIV